MKTLSHIILALGLVAVSGCWLMEDQLNHDIAVDFDSLTLPGFKGDYTFCFTSRDNCQVTCDKDWISIKDLKKNDTEYLQTISVLANITKETRKATLHISSTFTSVSITVSQPFEGAGTVLDEYPELIVLKKEFSVPADGAALEIIFQYPIKAEFSIDADWLTIKEESPRSKYSLSVAPNDSYGVREGTITINCPGNQKETVKVTQEQNNALLLSKKDLELDPEGGELEVRLNSNIDFNFRVLSATWISFIGQQPTKALTTYACRFGIDKNMTRFDREGAIEFYGSMVNFSDTLNIKQFGKESILLLRHGGTTFDQLTVEGDSAYGTIDWGDGSKEDVSKSISHTYSSGATRQIQITTHNSTGFSLGNIIGLERIDLSSY